MVFLFSIYSTFERNNVSASQQRSKKAGGNQDIIGRNDMKSNTTYRCQDNALLRPEISNEAHMDSANKNVITDDRKEHVIRDKDLELQSKKRETSFDGEKIMSEAMLSNEVSMLPDVVDCKGTYLQTLFFCF